MGARQPRTTLRLKIMREGRKEVWYDTVYVQKISKRKEVIRLSSVNKVRFQSSIVAPFCFVSSRRFALAS